MIGFRDFLDGRRHPRRSQCVGPPEDTTRRPIAAKVRAEGSSGVRQILIRDFHILTDVGPDCAGFNLGPTTAELQLGVLGSCLTQTFLTHAVARGIVLDHVEIDVTGSIDPRAGTPGYEQFLSGPRDIGYIAHIASAAADEEITALHDAVAENCPTLKLLRDPRPVHGQIVHGFVPDEAPS